MESKDFYELRNKFNTLDIFHKIPEGVLKNNFIKYADYAKAEKRLKYAAIPLVLVIIAHNLFLAGREVKRSTVSTIADYGGIYLAIFGGIAIILLVIQVRKFRQSTVAFKDALKNFSIEEKLSLQNEFNSIAVPLYGGQGLNGLSRKEVVQMAKKK